MKISDTQFLKLANSVHAMLDFPLFNPVDGYVKMKKKDKLDFLIHTLTLHVGNEFNICPDCMECMDEEVHLHGKLVEEDYG